MSNPTLPYKLQSGELTSSLLFPTLPFEKLKYHQSFFAFIDILGFKEIVKEKKECAPEFFYNIFSDLEFHGELYKSIRLKFLSDSILIWSDGNEAIDFWNLINIVCLVKLSLFKSGILVRGGISSGENFINDDFIISPSLIKAYQIEQRAIYPRIVIDRDILNLCGNESFGYDAFSQPYLQIGNYSRKVSPEILVTDFDGEIILDNFPDLSGTYYLKTGRLSISTPEDAPLAKDQIQTHIFHAQNKICELRKILMNYLNKNMDEKIKQKIHYLSASFNKWIDTLPEEYKEYKI